MSAPRRWLKPNLVDRLMLRLGPIQGEVVFHVFLDLDGDLDRGAFDAAAIDALRDHPLLATTIRRTPLGHVRAPQAMLDPAAIVAWHPGEDAETETAFVQAPFDPAAGPAVRLLVRPHGAGTRLVVRFLHAGTDGVGAFLWLDQLARRYRERLAGLPPAPAPAEPPTRSYAQYVRALSWRDRLAVLSRGADAVTGFFFGAGTGTGGPNADYAVFLDQPPPVRGVLRWKTVALDPAETAALKAWTRARGGTMNDVLFAAFAAAGQARFPQHAKPVVAHIPVNLRPPGPPAGVFNRVADVRVELDPRTLHGFEAAYAATLAVTPRARDRLQAIARVFERYLASHFPPGMFARLVGAYMDRPRNGVMTFDFSNLGALGDLPGDFGAARVARGFLVGPQASPPALGCYVTTIRGGLTLAIAYLHPCLAEASAEAIATDLRRTLLSLAEPSLARTT